MSVSYPQPTPLNSTVEHLTDRVANKADEALENSKSAAQDALNTMQDGVDQLREAIPSAFTRAAAQVEALTRKGIDRALQASTDVRDQVNRAGDRTADYVKEEPLKALLIAAAAGAALAGLVALLSRSHTSR